MFDHHTQTPLAMAAQVMRAAEAAARRIPPAFPLDATVAVNPFLGQASEDLGMASARLGRVAGVSLSLPRAILGARIAAGEITDDDLGRALIASPSRIKPHDIATLKVRMQGPVLPPQALPTVADLAAWATGTDWPAIIARSVGLWAAGHFDRGQALWMPRPGQGAFFGHMADQHHRATAGFGKPSQVRRAFAHLRHTARRAAELI